jgi:hypothetical protein
MSTRDCPNAVWMSFATMSHHFHGSKWTHTAKEHDQWMCVIFKEGRKAMKLLVIKDYTIWMGHVDMSDRIVDSYGISKRTWKLIERLFFHLSDLSILNLLSVLQGKYDSSELQGAAD